MHVSDANLRSPSYYIAQTQAQCVQCGRQDRVLALALPPDHRVLVDGRWQTAAADAFIFHVEGLPASVSRRLTELSPGFRLARTAEQWRLHWANHCGQCDRMVSDDDLHCEPGGFMPTHVEAAEAIHLSHVRRRISAKAAGYALAPEFFAFIKTS